MCVPKHQWWTWCIYSHLLLIRPFSCHFTKKHMLRKSLFVGLTVSDRHMSCFSYVPSLKLTKHLKMVVSNRNLLFQGSIFSGYVSFREGMLVHCSRNRLGESRLWSFHILQFHGELLLKPPNVAGATATAAFRIAGFCTKPGARKIRKWYIKNHIWSFQRAFEQLFIAGKSSHNSTLGFLLK